MQAPAAIILAAGKGTRMGSDLPKVLHPLGGRPLVEYPLERAGLAGARRRVVVVGHRGELVEAAVCRAAADVDVAVQAEQRGTGHAVLVALPAIADHDGPVLILSGDVPLLQVSTLRALVERCAESSAGLALVTFTPAESAGYGRILRDREGSIVGIREERDASPEERRIGECNAGIYCADAELLRRELPRIGSANAQGEIYLTDLVARARTRGIVLGVEADADEVAGINTPAQLAEVEARLRATGG